MENKSEGKAEKIFHDLGRKIDVLIQDLKSASYKMKDEYKDEIEELKRNKESLKHEFESFKEKHKDQWEEAEERLEKAGHELKMAFESIFKKTTEPDDNKKE